MKDDKHTIRLTPNAKARFWIERVVTGETSVKSRKTKWAGPFVDDPPSEGIDRIGYWIDTLVPHNDELTFTFDNPDAEEGERVIITFNGDTPLLDPESGNKVYAFELRSNESKTFKTQEKYPRDLGGAREWRCTSRTVGAKYTVAYLDSTGVGHCRALDPEVIIVH